MPDVLHFYRHMDNNTAIEDLIFADTFSAGTPEKPTVTKISGRERDTNDSSDSRRQTLKF